jgi:hypothetical protein
MNGHAKRMKRNVIIKALKDMQELKSTLTGNVYIGTGNQGESVNYCNNLRNIV